MFWEIAGLFGLWRYPKTPGEDKNMRIYQDNDKRELAAVICNKCKKELKVAGGILMEGCFRGNIRFGYFSNRDGNEHSFDLCEECYEEMIDGFAIPVEEEELNELL